MQNRSKGVCPSVSQSGSWSVTWGVVYPIFLKKYIFHYEGAFVYLTAPMYDSQVVSKDVQEKPADNSHYICRDKGNTLVPFLGNN